MPVHPGAAPVEHYRARGPPLNGAVDGAADRRRERHQHDPGPLSHDTQHAMAMFLTEVGDLGAGGFEDAQTQRGHEGEIVSVGGPAGGGEHGFELQVGKPQCR